MDEEWRNLQPSGDPYERWNIQATGVEPAPRPIQHHDALAGDPGLQIVNFKPFRRRQNSGPITHYQHRLAASNVDRRAQMSHACDTAT